jgi:hypothetical protein
VRSREQRTIGGSLAVRVGRCHLLDPDLVAAPRRDQPGQAGEVLLVRARELRDRRPGDAAARAASNSASGLAAITARAPATVRAAMIWVRICGR